MSTYMESRVIALAIKKFQKEQSQPNTDWTVEDSFVYALEEFDTGYDLTEEQYEGILGRIRLNCK